MNVQCEQCGETLKMRGCEQEPGNPKSRRWTLACPECGLVHQYDSEWVRIRPVAKAAGAGAGSARGTDRFSRTKAGFRLNTPALAR